jgi:Tfp pilus assembly protein PilV
MLTKFFKIYYGKGKIQGNRAFSLLETLVAISIFTTSILALMSIMTQGISNTGYAKKKIIASYLAQEGIEYMRNLRDTYVLYNSTSQNGWNAFNNKLSSAGCMGNNGCYFNADGLVYSDDSQPMIDITMTGCGSSCQTLLYDSTTGKYGYTTGVNSGYIRKIKVIAQPGPDETKISSTVYWTQGSGTYNMVFSESLFNWVE